MKTYRREMDVDEVCLAAQEALLGAIVPGLRTVSLRVGRHDITWRCVFADEGSMADGTGVLQEAAARVGGRFFWHCDLEREYLVHAGDLEEVLLPHVVFLRFEAETS